MGSYIFKKEEDYTGDSSKINNFYLDLGSDTYNNDKKVKEDVKKGKKEVYYLIKTPIVSIDDIILKTNSHLEPENTGIDS